MFFGFPEHLTYLRYEVLSPQRRYGSFDPQNSPVLDGLGICLLRIVVINWRIFLNLALFQVLVQNHPFVVS